MILLLFGAITYTGAAQQETLATKVNEMLFHCQIEGQDITFPCQWSELEQLGWSFIDAEEGDKVLLPSFHVVMLGYKSAFVRSPQNKAAYIYLCNLTDKEITYREGTVYHFRLSPEDAVMAQDKEDTGIRTVGNFKLPNGITGGVSTDENVIAIYGEPMDADYRTPYRYLSLYYQEEAWKDSFTFCIEEQADNAPGIVVGFDVTVYQEIARRIDQNGTRISKEEAMAELDRYEYKYRIIALKRDLQQALADSLGLFLKVARIKKDLAENYWFLDEYSTAFEWARQSAEEGYARAQFEVGLMYQSGTGIEQDYQAALFWFEKAAEQEDALAMFQLGIYYREGLGVEKSSEKSFQWFLTSAQNGYVPIYARLGDYYRDGIGVKQNHKEAVNWYEKAAESGDKIAIYNLSYMYSHGYGVKRNYTKAFEILLEADMNQYYVQQALGDNYYRGLGVEKDIEKALAHFNNFINLTDQIDIERIKNDETRKTLAKEIKTAKLIIKKHDQNKK